MKSNIPCCRCHGVPLQYKSICAVEGHPTGSDDFPYDIGDC